MKASTVWNTAEIDNNSSGFSALPGGFRDFDQGYREVGDAGLWWSSSIHSTAYSAWNRNLMNDLTTVGRYNVNMEFGLSVRCVKD